MTRFRKYNKGPLRIWERALPTVKYVAGIDGGEGIGDEDSAMHIYRRDTGAQVCEYVSNIQDPEEFTLNCVTILNYYNKAFVVPELNNTAGGSVLTVLKTNYHKGKIYRERVIDKTKKQKRLQYGWRTKTNNRGLIIFSLKAAIKMGFVVVRSQDTFNQLKTFVRVSPSRMEHAAGEKDDRVFAAGLAWQGFKDVMPQRVQQEIKKESRGITIKEFHDICKRHENPVNDFIIGREYQKDELSFIVGG